MNCPNCGHQNEDSSVFCEKCGGTLSAAPGPVPPTEAAAPQEAAGSNPGTAWLVANIILSVFCCNILSILGIVFAAMSVSKHNKGLYAESRAKAKTAKIMFITGLILGILTYTVFLVLSGFFNGGLQSFLQSIFG